MPIPLIKIVRLICDIMSYVKKGIEKQDVMHALGVTCLVLLHLIAMHLSYVQCSPFNSFFSLQNRRNTIIELYTCWLILLVTYSLIFIIIPQYLVSIPLFPGGFQEDTKRVSNKLQKMNLCWKEKLFCKGSQWKILR